MAKISWGALILNYSMDELVNPSVGTTMIDDSGSSRNATVYSDNPSVPAQVGPTVGVPSVNAALYGTAYNFTNQGTDMSYGWTTGAYGTLLTRDTALTYAAWVRPVATQGAGPTIIGSNGNGYSFLLSPSGQNWALQLAGYNAPNPSLVSLATLPSDVWTHVAVTKDVNGSGGADLANVVFYINGVAVETNTIGRSSGSPSSGRVGSIVIGGNAIGGYYQGGLDEVYVYDEVLSDTAIAALSVVPEPGTIFTASAGVALAATGIRRRIRARSAGKV
jgi:hypothetical protein